MEGVITNFRRGRHTQHTNQMIVEVQGVDSKEKTKELIGKTVIWTTPSSKEKRQMKGVVKRSHGNKGAVRVIFERGMPGQAVSQKVQIA
jgi:large subunit ribosomal protein L35Ae